MLGCQYKGQIRTRERLGLKVPVDVICPHREGYSRRGTIQPSWQKAAEPRNG